MYTTAPKLVVLAFLLVGGVVATVNYIDVEKVNQSNGRPRMLSVFSNVTRLLFRRQRSVQQDTSKHDVTDAERVAALKAHNDLRREVTPSASDMTHMIWNWELENMAQQWADACHYKHGQPHRDPSPFTSIGQNLWINTGGFDLVGAVNAWYGEVKYYDYNTNKCQPNKVCGHFTQVVWSSSREVGCGISYCEQTKGWNNRKAYYIVCNYGPPGNYVGTKPYKTGSPCSACPQSQPKCMNKLCRENPSCKSKKCLNGGVVDSSTCECKCEDGFHGSSCQNSKTSDVNMTRTLSPSKVTDATVPSKETDATKPSKVTDATVPSKEPDVAVPKKETNVTVVIKDTDDIMQNKETDTADTSKVADATVPNNEMDTADISTETTTTAANNKLTSSTGKGKKTSLGKTASKGNSKAKVSAKDSGMTKFFSFEMSFVMPDRTFDPKLTDWRSDLYSELQQTISNVLMDNSKSMPVYAVRNVKFTKGSIVVHCEVVTSENATTKDVRQLLLTIAANDSVSIAIEKESISVSEPVEIYSSEDHDIDTCASRPCQNGGHCVDMTSRYKCLCRDGYSGGRCENGPAEKNRWPCVSKDCFVDELEKLRTTVNKQPDSTIKTVFIVICVILAVIFIALFCLLIVKCVGN